jgi:hypothetical protein
MNNTWVNVAEHGQHAHGFVDILDSNIENKKYRIIINYLNQLKTKEQNIICTLFLEGNKDSWTKGTIKELMYSCETRIKEVRSVKFKHKSDLELISIQFYYVKELSEFEFGNFADFNIS